MFGLKFGGQRTAGEELLHFLRREIKQNDQVLQSFLQWLKHSFLFSKHAIITPVSTVLQTISIVLQKAITHSHHLAHVSGVNKLINESIATNEMLRQSVSSQWCAGMTTGAETGFVYFIPE